MNMFVYFVCARAFYEAVWIFVKVLVPKMGLDGGQSFLNSYTGKGCKWNK